ncbi:methyltransferase domain-containing protein [Candidatus Woesearchaeota archaeon]|nr:methyltransferase domain-containing protein [Candidatus Woesearchaeota archaeon]
MIQKILITKTGKDFFVKDLNQDFHTEFGFVKKSDLKKSNTTVKTNKNQEMYILEPSFVDSFKKIKRGPQIILPKDIGTIITETGINKDSIVLDAGGGSGSLSCFLANIVKKVYCYEIRKDFIKIIKENINLLNLKNITIKNKDVSKNITEKNLNLITLDLPEPWHVIPQAEKSLKPGAFLIAYLPTITQVTQFVEQIKSSKKLFYLKTLENIQRNWVINQKIVRPESQMIGHTGFIIIARKVIK